jgi:hypothetical protein
MDSEIEPRRKTKAVASKSPVLEQEQDFSEISPASVKIDSTATDNDISVERETINTDMLKEENQEIEKTDTSANVVDEVIKKMAKRLSRHRSEIDDLIGVVRNINKKSKNITIDQEFIHRIGLKLSEKFASKQEVSDLAKVVKVLSTDIDQLIKSLKKSNDELTAVVNQHKLDRKDVIKEVIKEDAVDSEDEGELVASGKREIHEDESGDDTVKTEELTERIEGRVPPVQSL